MRAVAFTPDGSRVITAGDDRVISIFDRASGKLLATRRGHAGVVTALAIGGDGGELWSASGDETARSWDIGVAQMTAAELDAFITAHVPWRLRADDRVDRLTADELRGGTHGQRRPDRQ